jgi:hypothetical protein
MTIKNLIAHFWDFWKNVLISGKNIIYPENFFVFRKNRGMSGKIFGLPKWYTDRKFFGDGGGEGAEVEQRGKVEYERERLLGIVNKLINIPSSLSGSYSTFLLCSWTTLIEIAVYTR